MKVFIVSSGRYDGDNEVLTGFLTYEASEKWIEVQKSMDSSFDEDMDFFIIDEVDIRNE